MKLKQLEGLLGNLEQFSSPNVREDYSMLFPLLIHDFPKSTLTEINSSLSAGGSRAISYRTSHRFQNDPRCNSLSGFPSSDFINLLVFYFFLSLC